MTRTTEMIKMKTAGRNLKFRILALQRMGAEQMRIRERGVLPESEIYFHTPSEMARRMFFMRLSRQAHILGDM